MNKNNTSQTLTSVCAEKQEHLSAKRLASLAPTITGLLLDRPTANFIDLMNWSEFQFKSYLSPNNRLNKFVHNRIIVDGQFMQYAEEHSISIECLYKDSIISWKIDKDNDKFFVQGVCKIKSKDCEFLQFALYHKGCQLEDEISFFIICDESNYESYLKMRNAFDFWLSERDRGNLQVRVVEAESIPYTKEDNTWEDLFLPDAMKSEIKTRVENFLMSRQFYLDHKIAWKMGLLLFGPPGNGKTSLIKTIFSQYPFKPVTVVAGANEEMLRDAFGYAESQCPALLYFEDLDSMLNITVSASAFLNLLDGVSTKHGLLVMATANEVRRLQNNIIDRPSRFDSKILIPLPTADMAKKYLKKWYGNMITDKKLDEIAHLTEKYGMSYAYLKELYITSMFEVISHNKKIPTNKDIDTAMKRIIREKSALSSSKISMDRYIDE